MCICKIPAFGLCTHSGSTNPSLTYIETDLCPIKNCANPYDVPEYRANEKCFDCRGVEPLPGQRYGAPMFFKHCFQSLHCLHEYEHFVTDIEREPHHPDVVLVTPMTDLCPECKSKGYDSRDLPPDTASIVPTDFQDIPRASMMDLGSLLDGSRLSTGVSVMPASSRRPTEASREPASKMASRTSESSKSRPSSASRATESSQAASGMKTSSHHHTQTSKAASRFPPKFTTQAPPANAPSLALHERNGVIMMSPPATRQTSSSAQRPSPSSAPHQDSKPRRSENTPSHYAASSSFFHPRETSTRQPPRTAAGHSVYPSYDITTPEERLPVVRKALTKGRGRRDERIGRVSRIAEEQ